MGKPMAKPATTSSRQERSRRATVKTVSAARGIIPNTLALEMLPRPNSRPSKVHWATEGRIKTYRAMSQRQRAQSMMTRASLFTEVVTKRYMALKAVRQAVLRARILSPGNT